ncbi:pre-mRNA splicing factor [Scheffersomyces coipomensis]|uniref:pre-mRNA splicing factor n=1 Tax=Scheffersomyces coipomensis TaxID=1788519 RepID=UPI00315DED3D
MTNEQEESGSPPQDVVIPPMDVKQTIEKTTGYVIKNGIGFVERLKSNNKDHKFDFLLPNHQYHGYYQWKLSSSSKSTTPTSSLISSNNDISGKDIPTGEDEIIAKPRELPFLIDLPMISQIDLEVIKLTALFVAKNGESYIKPLQEHQIKQGNKNQFEFLNENHSLYALFQTYVSQYNLLIKFLLSEENGKVDDEEVKNLFNQLEQADNIIDIGYKRSQYDLQHKEIEREKKVKQHQLQLQFASIDWQDFSIVGKIEFDAIDEVQELPVPLSREDLIYRSLESKNKDVIRHVEEEEVEKHIEEPIQEQEEEQKVIPQPFKGMKIKAAGESRLKSRSKTSSQASSTTSNGEKLIKCPITSQLIPESKFDNHLKVLLRDPKYKQEQDNFMRKNFTYASNLTSDQVYENIKRLVRKRQGGGDDDDDEDDKESNGRKRLQIGPH